MAIHKTPVEQLRQVQQQLQRETIRNQPVMANVTAATVAHDEGALWYRGRRYRVPSVAARPMIRLMWLDQEYRRLLATEPISREVVEQSELVVAAMLNIFWECVVVPWWRRRRGNPFLDAEVTEIEDLRRFFFNARRKLRVETRISLRAPSWLPLISETSWQTSLVTTLRTAGMASRAAGFTSRSDSEPLPTTVSDVPASPLP